jgi:hypothetical protein
MDMNFPAVRFINYFIVASVVLFSAGCAVSNSSKNAPSQTSAPPAAAPVMEIYEVHHDGRINVFYDRDLYKEFLSVGETPFRLTRIGAGPNGETLVFGLTKKDKGNPDNIDVIKVYDNSMPAPAEIYAEMQRNGRIYVFDNFDDMKPVREFGNPNLFYTEIGAGPNRETVVYVLNEKTKKNRPDALIAKFKSMNK